MKIRWRFIVFASVAFAAGPASAEPQARLGDVQGKVLVSTGIGFLPAVPGQDLKPGDRVMVTGDGRAVLTYGPDCALPLGPNSVTTVTDAGCTASAHDTGPDPAVNNAPAPPNTAAIAATLFVPAIAVGAIALIEDDDESVSP